MFFIKDKHHIAGRRGKRIFDPSNWSEAKNNRVFKFGNFACAWIALLK